MIRWNPPPETPPRQRETPALTVTGGHRNSPRDFVVVRELNDAETRASAAKRNDDTAQQIENLGMEKAIQERMAQLRMEAAIQARVEQLRMEAAINQRVAQLRRH